MFPSPLGVLGLTTQPTIRITPKGLAQVSVPSRGFGSDDISPLIPHKWSEKFPSPLGVLGLTTSADGSPEYSLSSGFRPLSGFWV
ncbi:Uncharacterised protein [Mycobacterium tuberculosis]|nr:Uncharacterised protein [Mycobacterium tuberculosis]